MPRIDFFCKENFKCHSQLQLRQRSPEESQLVKHYPACLLMLHTLKKDTLLYSILYFGQQVLEQDFLKTILYPVFYFVSLISFQQLNVGNLIVGSLASLQMKVKENLRAAPILL